MKIQISSYLSVRLRCVYCTLAVFAMIRVVLTNILNRSGIAVQWNGIFCNTKSSKTRRTSNSPRARNRFNQVVEAKRFEGVFLCRKVC